MEITNNIIFNCVKVGVITVILMVITEKILYKYNKKNNFLTRLKKKNCCLFILSLFIVGTIIQFFAEYTGFEAYCEKKCIDGKCDYVCNIKIKA